MDLCIINVEEFDPDSPFCGGKTFSKEIHFVISLPVCSPRPILQWCLQAALVQTLAPVLSKQYGRGCWWECKLITLKYDINLMYLWTGLKENMPSTKAATTIFEFLATQVDHASVSFHPC